MTFDWVTVGNAGNAADSTGYGAVGYEYRISQYEVTNAQYTTFLNAVDATGVNAYSLYDSGMQNGAGGILFDSGALAGAKYSVRSGRGDQPVVYVSFEDAARFTNWLHNGQGGGSTETGVYNLTDGLGMSRSADAAYYLPTQDEWYKAAYHDATAGLAGAYFLYGHGTSDRPVSGPPATEGADANYFVSPNEPTKAFGSGFAVTGGSNVPDNPLTDVGAYSEAISPYGLFDTNGNAYELTESSSDDGSTRVKRGGSWEGSAGFLKSTFSSDQSISTSDDNTGFRVASPVPEPGTGVLLLIVVAGFSRRRRA